MRRHTGSLHTLLCIITFVVSAVGLSRLSATPVFSRRSNTGIVGWVATHQYPKQQDYAYFYGAVVGIPMLVLGVSMLAGRGVRGSGRLASIDRKGTAPDRKGTAPKRGARAVRAAGIYVVLPALVYFVRYDPVIDGPLKAFNEGEFLVPLQELLAGGVPYRDVYIQHGLFHNAVIPLLGAKLFGPTLAGVRTVQHLADPCTHLAIYFLGLSLFRGRWFTATILALACAGTDLNPVARPALGLLSVACVAAGWHRGGRWLLLAGALAGLAFWHSLEVGLYALACGGLFLTGSSILAPDLVCPRRRSVALFAAGAAIGVGVVGSYVASVGALPDAVRNVHQQIAYQTEIWGLSFPDLSATVAPLLGGPAPPSWTEWAATGPVQGYLGAGVLALCAGWLAWRAGRGGFWCSPTAPRLLLLTLAGVLFFRSVLGRVGPGHWEYASFFAVLLGTYAIDHLTASGWDAGRRGGRVRALVLGLSALALAFATTWYTFAVYRCPDVFAAAWARVTSWPRPSRASVEPLPGAGIVDLDEEGRARIQRVVAVLQEHARPDERVYDFSDRPAFLFFARRRSGTRYFVGAYASPPESQREAVREIERHHTAAVLYPSDGIGIDGVLQAERLPIVDHYIRTHYEVVDRSIARILVLKRFTPAATSASPRP